jgi:hypothetical protein
VSAVITIASYWLTRHWFLTTGGDRRYTHVFRVDALLSKERFALSLLGVALMTKYWRRQSIDSFLSDALTYCKVRELKMECGFECPCDGMPENGPSRPAAECCGADGVVHRLAHLRALRAGAVGWVASAWVSEGWAAAARGEAGCPSGSLPGSRAWPTRLYADTRTHQTPAAVSYLLFPQPIYRGASAIEQFTPASFHQMVVESPQPADVSWLVSWRRSLCCLLCTRPEPLCRPACRRLWLCLLC